MTYLGFPGNPLPIRGEMFIDGAWTDITSRIRLASEIAIQNRGRANEQGNPMPCTCDFTLNNRDGLFNNRNPASAYYGLLPRNLPVRVSVTEDRSFAILGTSGTSRVKTTDKASLDIVGDIDIRIEVEPDNWTGGNVGINLCSKYRVTASANRAWALVMDSTGHLEFHWSTTGANFIIVTSTASLPIQYGPVAMRVTLDVNNGSGGYTVSFYTSDTISGSWTALGSPVVTTSGTTSIFSSNAEVELGRVDDGINNFAHTAGLVGRLYAFQLYNGIAGTLVANADVTAQARGTTSWSDGLGTPNTWTVEDTAEVTPDDRRFTGELASTSIGWDSTGHDIYVPVQAADVTRRLGKGAVAVNGPLKDYFLGFTSTGYWTAEDGTQATVVANSAPRGKSGQFSDAQFGTPSDLPASAGSITINSLSTRITLAGTPVANTGYACFNWASKMPATPAASTTLLDLTCTGGSVGRVNMSVTATSYNLAAYDTAGALITSGATLFTTATVPTNWNLYRIQMQQSGGNVQLDLGWYHPGENNPVGASALVFAGTVGRFDKCLLFGTTENVGTQFCHMFMGQFFLDNTDSGYVLSASAFIGETTTTRFARICTRIGVSYQIIGSTAAVEPMGAQPIAAPLTILQDCATTEGGQFYPDRNSLALVLRTRRALINQYGPAIDYAADELGPDVPLPIDDDSLLRNSVTATRADGSTGFSSQDTGPNSTADPTATPPGVGVVPGQINPNPEDSDRLNDMAAQDVFLGTWDEPRWPTIMVELARQNYVGTADKVRKGHILARMDVGDMFLIANPPAGWLAPDTITLMLQGVREVLGNRSWRFYWNTSPYGPFVGNDLTSSTASRYRAGAANCTVTAGFTSTATGAAVFTITTAAGSKLWGTTAGKPGNFPLNVVIAGEVITLSGITGTTSPQTANVSARSVNGVVKAHSASEAIQVQDSFYVGL